MDIHTAIYHMVDKIRVVWYSRLSQIGSHLRKFTPIGNVDRAIVQWQNAAIYEYNNVKITKIQDQRTLHPRK